jgi:hypothetical protein
MRNFEALNGLGRRLMSSACLLFLLAATTNAYSIVMRGGKRIEIPAQFSVTSMTLTYEATPGFFITLQMAAVDIPATERANNEMPGSLLARATKEKEPDRTSELISQAREPKASRSVTNRELQSFARLRLDSERAYEQRLRAQGLPPLAVLRAQAAADAERLSQDLARKRAEAGANESASQLQAQIAALSAKLDSLQSRNNSELSAVSPDVFPGYGDSPIYGNGPFYGNGPYGNGPYGNAPYGNGPYGNGPYGNGPYGNGPYGNGPYGNGPYGPYGNRLYYGGLSRVNPGLFQVPFGLPVGGAFGTFNVPSGVQTRFHGFRRNIDVAPGTQFGGRGGFRGGSHRGFRGGTYGRRNSR